MRDRIEKVFNLLILLPFFVPIAHIRHSTQERDAIRRVNNESSFGFGPSGKHNFGVCSSGASSSSEVLFILFHFFRENCTIS